MKTGLVIFTCRPKPPETYPGLNPATTTLEVWHEWFNAPVPQVNPHTLDTAVNPAAALTDEILDFGDLWLPTGKAFSSDSESPRDTNVAAQIRVYNPANDTTSVPVAKHWIAGTNGGSSWLVESVNWSDIQPKLASLPELSQAGGVASPTAQTAFTFPPPAPRIPARAHAPAVKLARAKSQALACVMDYVIIGTIATNYAFSNSWLYYIPIEGYFGAQVTFQPNCLIKYAGNADLLLYGSVVCSGTTNSPSILTSVYDDTGSIDIAGVYGQGQDTCPSVSASEALWLYYITSSVTISGMDVRWASRGVQFDDNGCGKPRTLSNSVIDSCSTAIYANNCTVSVTNLTLSQDGAISQTAGCGSVPSLTNQTALADAIASGMEALTNGWTPSTAEYIFNTMGPTTNVTLTNMDFNSNSWVHGLRGLSACAAGLVDLTTNGTTNFTYPNGPNCTLITPQHALVAWHQGYANGQNGGIYMFVGTNNVQYFGTVVGQVEVVTTNYYGLGTEGGASYGNDLSIIQFSNAIDSHVQPARILPETAIRKLRNVGWSPIYYGFTNTCLTGLLPCIGCDNLKLAIAVDLNLVALASGLEPQMQFNTSSLWFPNWAGTVVGGDSGSPIYVLIQNELVLMGAWHGTTLPPPPLSPLSPWCGYDVNTLNTTISNLCHSLGSTVYQVTTMDLSAFPDL